MKIHELRCVDYLDWLKVQEEFVLYEIELSSGVGDIMNVEELEELEEELQLIRELKGLVSRQGVQHEC